MADWTIKTVLKFSTILLKLLLLRYVVTETPLLMVRAVNYNDRIGLNTNKSNFLQSTKKIVKWMNLEMHCFDMKNYFLIMHFKICDGISIMLPKKFQYALLD